jgi:hypothetical protein
MKDGSPHQNTFCIFASSTVKILGLKKGSAAECDKTRREGKRKKRMGMGQD